MDCKATVKIGNYSRGGKTRGDNQAQDHDMGAQEKYIPCGILDEDTGQLYLNHSLEKLSPNPTAFWTIIHFDLNQI